jgi:hypothetical protein
MYERLWLIHNGVPYDVAFALSDAEALAHAIIFGMIQGKKWDWATMEFTS